MRALECSVDTAPDRVRPTAAVVFSIGILLRFWAAGGTPAGQPPGPALSEVEGTAALLGRTCSNRTTG